MTPRQKAQQIVDHAYERMANVEQYESDKVISFDSILLDEISKALQEAAKVEMPSEDEMEKAAESMSLKHAPERQHDRYIGFYFAIKWIKSTFK